MSVASHKRKIRLKKLTWQVLHGLSPLHLIFLSLHDLHAPLLRLILKTLCCVFDMVQNFTEKMVEREFHEFNRNVFEHMEKSKLYRRTIRMSEGWHKSKLTFLSNAGKSGDRA